MNITPGHANRFKHKRLNATDAEILQYLEKHKEGISTKDLAFDFNTSPCIIQHRLNKMRKAGVVVRYDGYNMTKTNFDMIEHGDDIKSLRLKNGLSMTELAELANSTWNLVSNAEHGRFIRAEEKQKILDALRKI